MTTKPPQLRRHSATYWYCADADGLLSWLDQRSDMHRWDVAAGDTRKSTEKTRFYHRPGRQWVERSGVVVERAKDGGAWIRLDGCDRVAALLRALEIVEPEPEPAAVEPEQLDMFGITSTSFRSQLTITSTPYGAPRRKGGAL